MEERENLIKFIDDNVLKKADSVEQFLNGIRVTCDYLKLKGPINQSILVYFKSLTDCANEIMSMKKKGVIISTSSFFPTNQNIIQERPTLDRPHLGNASHYSDGCSPAFGLHYSDGC